MSRGAWIVLIGVIMLIAGIGVFTYFTLQLIPAFTMDTLSPGEYLNETVSLEVNGVLTYFVQIQDYATGDRVDVFLKFPSGAEGAATVVTGGDFTGTHVATEAGTHTVVIQNTGTATITVARFASAVAVASATGLLAGLGLGFIGFVVLIVGIIIWVLDRRKARRPSEEPLPPVR